MADVFISYKRERSAAARHLSKIIRLHGYDTWYDYGLVPGEDFEPRLMAELGAAKAVVVLWCNLSTKSEWVIREAREARRLGSFLPTWIEKISLPAEFAGADTIDLSEWDGSPRSHTLDRLVTEIGRRVGRAPNSDFDGLRQLHEDWSSYGSQSLATFALRAPSAAAKADNPDQPSAGRVQPASLAESKPENPARVVAPAGLATSWPRTAAMALENPQFSFNANSDGELVGGDCDIDIRSKVRVALRQCQIFVESIDDGEQRYDVRSFVRTGRTQAGERGFELSPGQMRRFLLCARDIKDVISRPPWLLRLEGRDHPLFDDRSYTIDLKLISEHEFPTLVRLRLDIGFAKAVKATIVNQTV